MSDFNRQEYLTGEAFWNEYWMHISLPTVVRYSNRYRDRNEILKVLDRFLEPDPTKAVLEIGGAPGQVLAYLGNRNHYKLACIDYSDEGCRATRENMRLLGLPIDIYRRNLFEDDLHDLPRFDVVYSLGFLEHFSDLRLVWEKHLELLKPGGILILGTPNLRGIYSPFVRRMAPKTFAAHNLSSMRREPWIHLAEELGLSPLYCEYLGGWEPRVMAAMEKKTPLKYLCRLLLMGLRVLVTDRLPVLRRFNSSVTSCYLMGVYRKDRPSPIPRTS